MAGGLYQAYVCQCQECRTTVTVYTGYLDSAKQQLVKRGWGTSRGMWYCPTHVKMKQAEARAAGRQAKEGE